MPPGATHQDPKDPAGGPPLDVVVVGGSQVGLAMAWYPVEYDALPGMAFPAPADTYSHQGPGGRLLQAYAAAFDLPVRLGTRVVHLDRTDDGFEVRTTDDTVHARQVVVATGPFQVPYVPPAVQGLDPSVTEVHSAHYRNPRPCLTGPCWSSGSATRGCRSPRSWPRPAGSTCRSASGRRCCPIWHARSATRATPAPV
jgi:putative flavoprotein involved in K+ transport